MNKFSKFHSEYQNCPCCQQKILDNFYSFGSDVGILNNEIHLTDAQYGKPIVKFQVSVKTNKSNYLNNKTRNFTLKCQHCNDWYIINNFLIKPNHQMMCYAAFESVSFRYKGGAAHLHKQYKNALDAGKTTLLRSGKINEISNKFNKLKDYSNLEKKLGQLLLFDE